MMNYHVYSHHIKSALLLIGMAMAIITKAQIPTSDMIVTSEPVTVQTYSSTNDDGMENSELLKNFVQQRFDEMTPSYQAKKGLRRSAGSYLSGNDLNAYNYLKNTIRKIALGEISNTVISIPLTEITSDVGPWTAEQLGVNEIVVNKSITSEAKDAVKKKVTFDLNKVLNALLADYPYELFWYDKTEGCSYKAFDSYSYNGTQLSIKGNTTFTMKVAQEYAVQEGNKYYPTKFNTETVAAVNVAVANGKSIAESATGTTINKLITFKDKICELASYHKNAVTNSYPYGNPWQLVWVFDGDESTKVVCEGYSKAFKYLCDLSSLQDAECLIATGTMTGGTGAGGHMWNVMKMDDGCSYLIDVTNCDQGTIGYPDELFMAYYPSGSNDEGYTFNLKHGNITYIYDDDTKSTFSKSELTISSTKYNAHDTGIQTISTIDLDGTERWYDLNGKRLQKPTKGINIVKNRKVVIK